MASRAEGDGFQAGSGRGDDDAEVTVHAAGEEDDEDYEEAGDYISENDLDEEDEETTAWAYYCGDWLVVAATWSAFPQLSVLSRRWAAGTEAVEGAGMSFGSLWRSYTRTARTAGGFGPSRVWHSVVGEAMRNATFLLPIYERIVGPVLPPEVANRPFWLRYEVKRFVETTIGAVLYRPFRLVLNRLQGQVPLPGGGYRYTGLFQGLHVAWKQEGWGLFTRNLPLEVLSNVIYNFSQDAIFSSGIASRLHRFLPSSEHELVQYVRSWALEVVENIVCMNASYLLTWPLHVVACRMDTEEFGTVKYAGALDCARHVFQNDGVSGFYKGCLPEMLRASLSELVFSGSVAALLGSLFGFAWRTGAFDEEEEDEEDYDNRELEWHGASDEENPGLPDQDDQQHQQQQDTDIDALD